MTSLIEFFKQILIEEKALDQLVENEILKPLKQNRNWTECTFTPKGIQVKVHKPAYLQKPGAGRRGLHHHNMLMLFLSRWMEKNRIKPRYHLIANTMKSSFPEDFAPSFGFEHVRQTCRRTAKKREQIREINNFKRHLLKFKSSHHPREE